MSTPIKVYLFPLSQPSRSVRMLCREAGIPTDESIVNLMAGEHKKPEFLAVNPAGLVPSIVDGDFVLSECGAILVYLCESRELTNWYPTDPKVRARYCVVDKVVSRGADVTHVLNQGELLDALEPH